MTIVVTASQAAEALASDVRGVAAMLLPEGREKSGEWCVGSVAGEPGKSLKVRLTGPKAGTWRDFAEGHGGDLLDLWAAVRGQSIGAALADVCQYLGIKRPDFSGSRIERSVVRPPKGSRKAADDAGVMRWLQEARKLSVEAIAAYRVGSKDGAVALPAFAPDGGSVQYIKYRSTRDKKFWSEAGGKPCLFGWQAIPDADRSVVICEGELDALAWYSYGYPALSPTNGATNCQWIDVEFDRLARFDAIYLSFDMDEAGRQALPEIVERLGAERCRVIELPAKDANQCLLDGIGEDEIAAAYSRARSVDPEELVPASHFAEEVIRLFDPDQGGDQGVVFPWRKGRGLFRFRPGEVSLVAGTNGHGKSQLAGHLTLGAMEQGERCCVASMEFKPSKWLQRLTRQASAMPRPAPDYIRAIHDWYDGKLWAFNCTGMAKADRILEVFRYAARRYGIRWFVIDNLAKCGFDEDDYNSQKRFVDRLTDFARDHDAHVVLCLHMRKGETEEKPAGKMDIKGTGAITDMVDSALIIWRNKKKEKQRWAAEQAGVEFDESESADALLTCVKQRNGEHEPTLKLWFCPQSNQYLDGPSSGRRQYVPWSRPAAVPDTGVPM